MRIRGFIRRLLSSNLAVAAIGTVVFAAIGFLVSGLREFPLPFEDAAMSLRYAQNLADSGQIVWNIGDTPGASDGLTDLALVWLIAPLILLGFLPEVAVLLLNLIGVFLILYLLLEANSRFFRRSTALVCGASATILLHPLFDVVGAGFSSSGFGALLLLIAFSTAFLLLRGPTHFGVGLGLGLIASSAVWWRPEGALLGVFAFVAGAIMPIFLRRDFPSARLILASALGFLGGLALFVAFRLLYFGSIFPTAGTNKAQRFIELALEPSFYIPGTLAIVLLGLFLFVKPSSIALLANSNFFRRLVLIAGVVLGGLGTLVVLIMGGESATALEVYFLLLLPPFLLLAIFSSGQTMLRLSSVFLVSLALMSVVWAPFDLTFNWWARVYWPLVPLALFVLLGFAGGAKPILPSYITKIGAAGRVVVVLVGLAISQSSILTQLGKYYLAPFHVAVAERFRTMDNSQLRLATSEAGLIPFMAKDAQSLDTWIYNTRAIAENGVDAVPTVLAEFSPNVIIVHGPTISENGNLVSNCEGPFALDWWEHTQVLYRYTFEQELTSVYSVSSGQCDYWTVFYDPEELPEFEEAFAPRTVEARMNEILLKNGSTPGWPNQVFLTQE